MVGWDSFLRGSGDRTVPIERRFPALCNGPIYILTSEKHLGTLSGLSSL